MFMQSKLTMKALCKLLLKYIALFVIGGVLYCFIEILWRGYTHYSMAVVGGVAFLVVGEANEDLAFDMPLWEQMLFSACWITAIEFISGLIINRALGWNVWDYSHMPLNLLGQICLPYSILWFFLSLPALVLDDYLRYWLWQEEKPHYHLI